MTFENLDLLQTQVSESGLALCAIPSVNGFAAMDWICEWGSLVDVDKRAGDTIRMPSALWHSSQPELPSPRVPAFHGEHNETILRERNMDHETIKDLKVRGILLSRRHPPASFD